MDDDQMLDTDFLYQPKGRKGWCFRMRTPDDLLGFLNPRTGKPYGKEIRAGLGTRDLREARERRDILLGQIRAEARKVQAERDGDTETALAHAQALQSIADPDVQEAVEAHIHIKAERIAERAGDAKAKRWYQTATGSATPVSVVYEKYVADKGKALTPATLVNLRTAWNDFQAFAGEGVTMEAVDRRLVADFVTEYLPSQKTPRTPNGPGPATIRKKVSLLGQVWQWAMQRGYIPFEAMTPWDKQAPSKKAIKAAAKKTRIYTPEEVRKLFEAIPQGTREGDVIRIALLSGVRLSEITRIEASWVDEDCGGYSVPSGKTDNAARYVPLVGPAKEVVKARVDAVKGEGMLFPDLKNRPSDGKNSAAVSSRFTRLRRKILGEETDGELKQHAFRHTWRTAARRAGVDLRTTHELGGWSRGDNADTGYDHGLEKDRYRQEQEKVAQWLQQQGYLMKR